MQNQTDNFLGFGKKAKAKRVAKTGREKSRAGQTLTDALNTYRSVKTKIVGTKATRQAKRSANNNEPEDIYQLPRLENNTHLSELYAENPLRTTGVYEDSLSIDEKMKTPGNITRGLINRETGIAYNTPFGSEGSLREFVMETTTKKSNTWLYLLLAAIVGFAIYKMTAKK